MAASVTGPAHTARGVENQDAFGYRRLGSGFVLAVADGAGSRRRAALGARLAADAACDAASQVLGDPPADLAGWMAAGRTYLESVFGLFDRSLSALTTRLGGDATPADYATTLLAVVAHPPRYFFFNVGDGFLVVEHEAGGGHLVSPPDTDGDRGSSVFLTSVDRADAVRVGLIEDRAVHGVVLCTDGLIEAVLTADQWPDGGQRLLAPADFDLYPRAFRTAAGTEPDELGRRLQSAEIAATSGDDKTMVLAVHG